MSQRSGSGTMDAQSERLNGGNSDRSKSPIALISFGFLEFFSKIEATGERADSKT